VTQKWTSYKTGDPVEPPANDAALVDHLKEPFCRLGDIVDGQARGFESKSVLGVYSVIIVRKGSAVFGYANSCPHVGTPLDWSPDQFMDLSGENLRCATHGATFRIEDGFCISGPCEGDSLRPVQLEIRNGDVFLAAAR